jgi:hypothetical protein
VVKREILLASALIGAAACGSSCEHRGQTRRSDPLAEPQPLEPGEVALRLWPVRARGSWVPLADDQREALEQLVLLLLDHAESGQLSRRERRFARVLAEFAGFELVAVEIGEVKLWLVTESVDRVRGAGAYVIRLGPAQPLLLSAPHSFYDQGTGDIGLALLLEPSEDPARALFVNTVHRYRQIDGRKIELEHNPADSANVDDHPLASTTRRALEHQPLTLIQLHGYGRDARSEEPLAILSSGHRRSSTYVRDVTRSLRRDLPELAFGTFGIDIERLGGTRNRQARAATEFGRCFVHVEFARELRVRLLAEPELRERMARALLIVPKEPGDCR